jgi:hypothetical protein
MQSLRAEHVAAHEEGRSNACTPPIAEPAAYARTSTGAEQPNATERDEEAEECWTNHGGSEEDDQWMPGRVRDIFLGALSAISDNSPCMVVTTKLMLCHQTLSVDYIHLSLSVDCVLVGNESGHC